MQNVAIISGSGADIIIICVSYKACETSVPTGKGRARDGQVARGEGLGQQQGCSVECLAGRVSVFECVCARVGANG